MNMMNMMNMQNMINPVMNMQGMSMPNFRMGSMTMPGMGLFSEAHIIHFLMNINEYIKFLQGYILTCLEKENRQQQDLNDLRSNINQYIMNIQMNFGINMGMMGPATIPYNINKIKNDMTQFFCQLNSFDKVKEDYFEADKIKIENDTILYEKSK